MDPLLFKLLAGIVLAVLIGWIVYLWHVRVIKKQNNVN